MANMTIDWFWIVGCLVCILMAVILKSCDAQDETFSRSKRLFVIAGCLSAVGMISHLLLGGEWSMLIYFKYNLILVSTYLAYVLTDMFLNKVDLSWKTFFVSVVLMLFTPFITVLFCLNGDAVLIVMLLPEIE